MNKASKEYASKQNSPKDQGRSGNSVSETGTNIDSAQKLDSNSRLSDSDSLKKNPVSHVFIALIQWYQRTISAGTPRRCKYQPTCSQYAVEAIQKHGPIKGTLLSSWRILRCNPWSKGGVDWVPERGQWPKKPMGLTELMEYRKQQSLDLDAASNQQD
ncbi:membrane protein insertion efficiency factor YidD [Arcanobacterium ihumii]|uniref:membrane protein insertion efficiency factor YidD n=1 Tax=Arcanobacterium ihumii TaxID=2138162 RepID=UPI000F529751|nr:membrane protein insertion efficiency factor YidD [Arcanobacterium ihumii]